MGRMSSCSANPTPHVPLKDLRDKQAWIAFRFDGGDLAPEHGGPARLLVPHLYFWKSAELLTASGKVPTESEPSLFGATGAQR